MSKHQEDDDGGFMAPVKMKTPFKPPSWKKPKGAGRGGEGEEGEEQQLPLRAWGRVEGGRGFMNFGNRKDPPHKGKKVTLMSLSMF